MVRFVLIHFSQELMCSSMNHTEELCSLIKSSGIKLKKEHDRSDVNQTCSHYSPTRMMPCLVKLCDRLVEGSQKTPLNKPPRERKEDEYDYGNYWGSSSWGHHGVQDAKWLEPKDEWPVNPKSEDWGDDTGGWGGKQEWSGGAGWWNSNKWSGWNTGWNHNQGWKRKAPWAYNKHENPKHGQYVKGGFEADGEFYESL